MPSELLRTSLGSGNLQQDEEEHQRGSLSKACGYIMSACIVLIGAYFGYGYLFADGELPLERYSPVLRATCVRGRVAPC